jgi:hypothetical protein
LADVFVDEDRDDRRIWCGTVSNHSVWPGPNETEISHGMVSWQTRKDLPAMGPLASSFG